MKISLEESKLIPKVLIGAPVSDRHREVCLKWLEHLNTLTYPNLDVCLVENTLENTDYYEELKKRKVQDKDLILIRHEWDPKVQHPVQMLADAREKIRKYFLENNYDYLFWLDDDIFIPKNGIQRLLSYNKDCVGFYVHVFPKNRRKPCLLKSGEIIMGYGLDFFKFKEINEYKKIVRKIRKNKLTKQEKNLISFLVQDKWHPQLMTTYGVGLGCLMTSKKIMETVPFRTHPSFIYGEDLWFYAEANDKNFKFWCDTDVRARHENTEWASIMKKSNKRMNIYLIHGYSDAKEAAFVNYRRGKNGKKTTKE